MQALDVVNAHELVNSVTSASANSLTGNSRGSFRKPLHLVYKELLGESFESEQLRVYPSSKCIKVTFQQLLQNSTTEFPSIQLIYSSFNKRDTETFSDTSAQCIGFLQLFPTHGQCCSVCIKKYRSTFSLRIGQVQNILLYIRYKSSS